MSKYGTISTKRTLFIGLLLASEVMLFQVVSFAAPEIAASEENFIVYEIKEGDTLQALAKTYLGDPKNVPELLAYNEIVNPALVVPGLVLAIPTKIRTAAIEELNKAQDWLLPLGEVEASTYAPIQFAQAEEELAKARNVRNQAIYDKTIVFSKTAQMKLERAYHSATNNAWRGSTFKVTDLQEPVEISTNRVDWFLVKINQSLTTNVVIRTHENSRAELTFEHDGSIIRVQENTEMVVSVCKENARTKVRNTRLRVLMGNIIGEIVPRKPEDTKTKFDIDAGKAAIAIRGTALRVSADEENTTRVSLLETEKNIEMTADAKGVTLESNEGTFSKNGAAPAPPVVLPDPPSAAQPAAGNPIVADLTPAFTWEHPKIAVQPNVYHFEIATDENFNRVIQNSFPDNTRIDGQLLPEGKYFWRISSIDKHGLEGHSTEPRAFTILKNLQFNFKRNPAGATIGNREFARPGYRVFAEPLTEDTSITSYELSLDGETFAPLLKPHQLILSRDHTIHIRSKGEDGSVGEVQSLTITIDGVPPKITPEIAYQGTLEDLTRVGIVTLGATDASGIERIEYSTNGKTYLLYTEPVSVRLLTDQTIYYRATDVLGNTSNVDKVEIKGIQAGQ